MVSSDIPIESNIQADVYNLGEQLGKWTGKISGTHAELVGNVPPVSGCGYLVRLICDMEVAFTAFDVLDHWTQAPRYGYIFDFKHDRTADDIAQTLDYLLALHINGLQFYDWQYRHDTLIPPQDEFTDPLGRPLSLTTVRNLIVAAHMRSMAAMPYTAIYAASPDYAASHAEWALYNEHGQVVDFANGFLKLMNPQCGWQQHFVQECASVLTALPFDGIHIDQYGEPKTGFDSQGDEVDLASGFADTLQAVRNAIGTEKILLFNLVHNWPVEEIASSPLDFWYSELWPPDTSLRRLWQIIRENRALNSRPAVLAVYIPPSWEHTVLAAQSRILAAGGTHIAHGEHSTYLSDPYFPKAELPSPALKSKLKQLADFAVAYEQALVFSDDITDTWSARVLLNNAPVQPGDIIVKAQGSRLFINLLRTGGNWSEELSQEIKQDNVSLTLITRTEKLSRVWCATPEAPLPNTLSVETTITLPLYVEWLLICFEFGRAVDARPV